MDLVFFSSCLKAWRYLEKFRPFSFSTTSVGSHTLSVCICLVYLLASQIPLTGFFAVVLFFLLAAHYCTSNLVGSVMSVFLLFSFWWDVCVVHHVFCFESLYPIYPPNPTTLYLTNWSSTGIPPFIPLRRHRS